MKRQKILIIAGGAFLILLITATIYSRTVYQWQLPKVELTIAQNLYSSCTVPPEAVYADAQGKTFILLVKERKGVWGKEYVCVRQYVSVSEKGKTRAILNGIDELKYPVVTGSDKPVSDGSIVRFYP